MNTTTRYLGILGLCLLSLPMLAQSDRWQQHVNYTMDIDMDVKKHCFEGKQTLVYTNNSPDTLTRVFYHLYFNAFQPGSVMDVRNSYLPDPDARMMLADKKTTRMSQLKESEQGWHKISKLTQDGADTKFEVNGTILEVDLAKPILPGQSQTFYMEFKSQVPIQIRRSGRDNAEGIAYTMTQWYPKMCEYDYQGWHAHPYVGREFYGIWGEFDVTIHIDSDFVLGGTGYLQNPNDIGHGYQDAGVTVNNKGKKKLSWQFKADRVHDFAWAADPDFKHIVYPVNKDLTLHFLYQSDSMTEPNWKKLPEYTAKAISFASERFGQYPYKQFSVIQGGDGGMEYPMCTMITGRRPFPSLFGVTVHEMMHSWYYGIIGNNENLYPWMDEGFTSFAENVVQNEVLNYGNKFPNKGEFETYFYYVNSGKEEALSTHADHFNTNMAFGLSSYVKGAVFLCQLEYIMGEEVFARAFKRYFETWKFKHPNPNDMIRIMEKESGLELDWYKEYWVNTTYTIDYAIEKVKGKGKTTEISLQRIGLVPMPVDLEVELNDGSKILYTIPLDLMRGAKTAEIHHPNLQVAADWNWTNKTYTLEVAHAAKDIKKVIIDPNSRMADVDRKNNELVP